MQDCYYIVTTPASLANVDASCKSSYGPQATILGLTLHDPKEYRVELNFYLSSLISAG